MNKLFYFIYFLLLYEYLFEKKLIGEIYIS